MADWTLQGFPFNYRLKWRPPVDYPDDPSSIEFEIEEFINGVEWERVAEGFLRFDGCINLTVGPEGMAHFCGLLQWTVFSTIICSLYATGKEVMPGWCGD